MEVGYEMSGRTAVVIAFNTTINRPTEKWSKIRMSVEQCDRDQAVSSTSCTPYRTIDFSDPCGMMLSHSMPWARVIADVQPKLRCPVDKLYDPCPPSTAATGPGQSRRAPCRMATPRVSGLLPLLAVLVLGASAARRLTDSTHLELRPVHIQPCVGDFDNALKSLDVAFEMRGRTSVVFNVNMTVSRSVDRWVKGYSIIEKCDQTVSADTCTTFRVFESGDLCGMFMNRAMPWAKIVDSVTPKMGCPINKGTYRLTNGTLSMDLLNAMSSTLRLEGPVWRARSHCVDPRGDVQFCMDTAGELFRVRNRPNKGKGL
ncbi:uncharacterized protein LOC113206780 [Frankliniella occidentalis]|uniref:Uncharacterized protein LOC113206780 n=1 Tax=Frankliniella occidentalis TaxID=133901 RepID=A0A9C6U568_FRAOC|nr:uncharacterized protein LOC113206780 [Frankliniella occidentalis]